MDITDYIFPRRDAALAIGDYNSYRAQLTRQISSLRKKLGRSTPAHAKFDAKKTVTAEDIGNNHEFVHLLLLTSERAWAHALHMRSAHAEDQANGRITGNARSHILSRLSKAEKKAKQLVELLHHQDITHATEKDLLEAEAYCSTLRGAENFERDFISEEENVNSWGICLEEYCKARVIYNSLLHQTKKDIYKEVLAGTIDPSIRYAAYKLRIPRTIAITTIAKRHFPSNRSDLTSAVTKLDPNALSEEKLKKGDIGGAENLPNSITWRSRTANIADASIGQGLAAVDTAESRLESFLNSAKNEGKNLQDRAAAYDDVLIASQDTVDVTRRAIEELEREGVAEGDTRIQDLRVTDLAVNYALVGWRVGRNRVLIGFDDGLSFSNEGRRILKKSKTAESEWIERPESYGRKLARLRERVTLFDSILQSIDSVKEFRGAARDSGFMNELEAKKSYFRALRCINLAFSHDLNSGHAEALALTARAHDLLKNSAPLLSSQPLPSRSRPPTLEITAQALQAAEDAVATLLRRYQAIADLQQRSSESAQAYKKNQAFTPPLVQRIMEYPPLGAELDLAHLVNYPPRLQPVPVKPIFLDVAWNYIDYPGRSIATTANGTVTSSANTAPRIEEQKPAKKGWFGFGR